jgi:small subunit ribosomal protein S17
MKKEQEIIRKKFSGVVVKDANEKTVLVRVETVKTHPKYHKRYTVSRNYQVHDEKNEYKIGDKLVFVECRPYSKSKKWRVINAK